MAAAVSPDPIAKLVTWLEEAKQRRVPSYDAMALATSNGSKVSVRFVLLKGIDNRGLLFFTDARSRKAGDLKTNPNASLAFYWAPIARQVRIEGPVEQAERSEADAYWTTRPRQSRLAASVSRQTARMSSRADLVARLEKLAEQLRGREVPCPPFWTGFRLRPATIEFWRHRAHRLHDREVYFRRARGWQRYLLQP